MDEERANYISIDMYQKLCKSSPVPSDQFSIFRVPDALRKVHEKSYEPQVVSIGPYHGGKAHLQRMEAYKMHYLRQLLRRRTSENENIDEQEELRQYVMAIGALEESARKCYEEPISLSSEEFVQMLILDGCFILEFMRSRTENFEGYDDPKFIVKLNLNSVGRDLLLLENQLPLFVLLELFNLANMSDQHDFPNLITNYVKLQFEEEFTVDESCDPLKRKHLLDFVHFSLSPRTSNEGMAENCDPVERNLKSRLLNFVSCLLSPRTSRKEIAEKNYPKFIRCATELREAGITFKKAEKDRNLFDVRFKSGTVEIPSFTIEDETETILHNMIAYEQLPPAKKVRYVTDYMILMDGLIDSKKDVKLLCRDGIIKNHLGDDEVIATLFNKLRSYAIPSSPRHFYSELFKKVNKHCSKKHNEWMANLRHHYFNTPWAMISFFAAVALLTLALIQTVYTVLSYYKD